MSETTVLVVAGEDDPELAMLAEVPGGVRVVKGLSAESLLAEAPGAAVMLNWSAPRAVLREVFLAARHLKWVHSKSAGLDSMLFPELVESDVVLTNAMGVYSAALGEFAITAMLFFAKDLARMRRAQAARRWEPFDVERLEGKTLGIVGFGDIGRAVAVRAHALGVRVVALRRSAALRPEDEGLVDAVYAAEQLKEMLPLCDFVVLATPLTPATLKLISKAELAAMKRTAFLINLGRGPVVDEAALIEALQEGVIRGAGLDVFEKEPLPAESPLYSMDNVLLSPHCADNTVGWKADSMRFFLEQLKRYQAGEPLKNIVDKKRGY